MNTTPCWWREGGYNKWFPGEFHAWTQAGEEYHSSHSSPIGISVTAGLVEVTTDRYVSTTDSAGVLCRDAQQFAEKHELIIVPHRDLRFHDPDQKDHQNEIDKADQ